MHRLWTEQRDSKRARRMLRFVERWLFLKGPARSVSLWVSDLHGGQTVAAATPAFAKMTGRTRRFCEAGCRDSLTLVSKRPPLLGYNHNVRHAGRLFHVQTEDSGPARPVLSTHLFIEGTILSSQRTTYPLDEPEAVTQKRMQEQHKNMLKRLRDGQFDHLPEVQRHPAGKGGDHAAPTANAGAGNTQKTAVPPAAQELSPKDIGSSPILSPVPPPPAGLASGTGALAERLRKLSAGSAAAQAASAKPTAADSKVVISPELVSSADDAVVEIEAAADDDEPAVTFEAEADDEDILSQNTPLPKARPLLQLDEDNTAQFGASQMPVVSLPPSLSRSMAPPSVMPSPAQRSIPTYTIPPELFKPRPTAEGVTLKRSPPVPIQRAPSDPIRTTMVRARPTRPAPLAPALRPGQILPPDSPLDAELLAYLARGSTR